jgi:NAD(P)H dehydrogenase (quinone)
MKTGIIVYSQTGNTLAVAQRIQETIIAPDNEVSILKVAALNEQEADLSKIQLSESPETGGFDVLIFGSPVHGFSLAPVMMAYMNQNPSLSGKRIACYVTQGLPKSWMGGKRALRQMVDICEKKGASIYSKGIVNWPKPLVREELIQKLARQFRFEF